MSSGGRNQLARQMGEHLVCAELARRGFYATPFAGNVPGFDVVAADDRGRILRVQVKASRSEKWPTDARDWMDIRLEENRQVCSGLKSLSDSALIYVCVALASVSDRNKGQRDRFFVLRAADLQSICFKNYSGWMGPHGWKRPRNPESFDCRYGIGDLEPFEDNWALLDETDRVAAR